MRNGLRTRAQGAGGVERPSLLAATAMADNLSYEDLRNIVDSYVVKSLRSVLVVSLPPGSWNSSILPLDHLIVSDNSAFTLCDIVFGFGGAIDWADLEGKYKHKSASVNTCNCYPSRSDTRKNYRHKTAVRTSSSRTNASLASSCSTVSGTRSASGS